MIRSSKGMCPPQFPYMQTPPKVLYPVRESRNWRWRYRHIGNGIIRKQTFYLFIWFQPHKFRLFYSIQVLTYSALFNSNKVITLQNKTYKIINCSSGMRKVNNVVPIICHYDMKRSACTHIFASWLGRMVCEWWSYSVWEPVLNCQKSINQVVGSLWEVKKCMFKLDPLFQAG